MVFVALLKKYVRRLAGLQSGMATSRGPLLLKVASFMFDDDYSSNTISSNIVSALPVYGWP